MGDGRRAKLCLAVPLEYIGEVFISLDVVDRAHAATKKSLQFSIISNNRLQGESGHCQTY